MIFTVQELMKGRPLPIATHKSATVVEAIGLLTHHDFGQLPVLDDDGKVAGLITSDSIVKAANHFGVLLTELHVRDCLVPAKTTGVDGDLFEVLDEVQANYAVLVVDGHDRLTGIITNFDTTAYFRRRAEDMMVIEDIETRLEEYILAIYRNEKGQLAGIRDAINSVANRARKLREQYEIALRRYLEKSGPSDRPLQAQAVEDSFRSFGVKDEERDLDELSFDEFTAVLLRHKDCPKIGSAKDGAAVRKLLNNVRDTRNILAHFRGEISVQQRHELRFCSDWLSRTFSELATLRKEVATVAIPSKLNSDPATPTEEDQGADDSVYAPLAERLRQIAPVNDEVDFSFPEIEKIIARELPKSAREHRAWWANHPGNVQAAQWLDVGWRVKSLLHDKVTFSRIEERENAYIRFFAALVVALQTGGKIKPPDTSPQGLSYLCCAVLRGTHKRQLRIYASFSRGRRLRVELYIDVGARTANKGIFDSLTETKAEIEHAFGAQLSWERLESRSACRIAAYHPDVVHPLPDEALVPWAKDAVQRMFDALSQPARKALDEVAL